MSAGQTYLFARPDIHDVEGMKGAKAWTEGWVPEYARDARKTVLGATKDARDRQTAALNLLQAQTQGPTTAQRTAALQLAKAGNQPVGVGGLGTRTALMSLGQAGSQIAGQGMGRAADERARAHMAYSKGTGQAIRGRLAAEQEALQLRGLGFAEKDAMRRMALAREAGINKNLAARYGMQTDADQSTMNLVTGGMQAFGDTFKAGAQMASDYLDDYGSNAWKSRNPNWRTDVFK